MLHEANDRGKKRYFLRAKITETAYLPTLSTHLKEREFRFNYRKIFYPKLLYLLRKTDLIIAKAS